ncbi:MAG: T9SS type A sorting domain-containing protein [Ignavibacteriales bacterium]|nr:T9SS type A sorting domain-containing protein [Ignavibacteriales bacterium]
MEKLRSILVVVICTYIITNGQVIEKTYYFDNYTITKTANQEKINFNNTLLTGKLGEPVLPYHTVSLLLPPGEIAESIEIIGEDEVSIQGNFKILPQQFVRPISEKTSGEFVKNELIYSMADSYPSSQTGELLTQYMNGYSIVLSTFTPLKYFPASGKVSFFKKITIRIHSRKDSEASDNLAKLNSNDEVLKRIKKFVQNPDLINLYPKKNLNNNSYQLLIISPSQFEDGFLDLINLYRVRGIKAKIISTDSIYALSTGQDSQEKIRNYIIQEYQNNNIEYVLLGGDIEHIPYRGFYCKVQSSAVYEDDNIPADLYYSALDGTWNNNGNSLWGEIGEDDLLPEISVARISVSNLSELSNIINKIKSYQDTPVLNELDKPLLAGEHLWSSPLTWGGDYLDLLIGFQDDSGYTTIGIPIEDNIEKLYDRDLGYWSGSTLISKINEGKSFIYHAGHSNYDYAMRLDNSDITNENFSQANGVIHNYTSVNTTGCNCGGFDQSDCIAERMVNISNFAVSFIGNSRYGWFNEGQTEGPSTHLQREFVDALYNDRQHRIGTAHLISKIESAPWVTAPGQWEEGALRWCFYCNNVLGDPAMGIWTNEPINIQASYQSSIQPGTSSVDVSVTSDGFPVEGLTCVILKDSILYGVNNTDTLGNCNIILDPPITEIGNAELIISGYNCLPVSFPLTITSIEDDRNNVVLYQTKLYNNYPNPFNPSTIISYSLPEKSFVKIKILDMLGREIINLVNEEKPAGVHQVEFKGYNLASGVYLYRIEAGNYSETKKMILLK